MKKERRKTDEREKEEEIERGGGGTSLTPSLAKSLYALSCLAFDVFVYLQIYDLYPNEFVGFALVLALIATTVFELWIYASVLRWLRNKKSDEFAP